MRLGLAAAAENTPVRDLEVPPGVDAGASVEIIGTP
jgi:hypothetical protein